MPPALAWPGNKWAADEEASVRFLRSLARGLADWWALERALILVLVANVAEDEDLRRIALQQVWRVVRPAWRNRHRA